MIDYYKVLQLPRTATKSDIKRSFKRLALKWHPDKNPRNQEEAAVRFKEISDAYAILYHDESRRKYDDNPAKIINPLEDKPRNWKHYFERHGDHLFSFKDPKFFEDICASFANDNFSDVINSDRSDRQQAYRSHFDREPYKSYMRDSYCRFSKNCSPSGSMPSEFRFCNEYKFCSISDLKKRKLCHHYCYPSMQILSEINICDNYCNDELFSNVNVLLQSFMCITALCVSCFFLYLAVLL